MLTLNHHTDLLLSPPFWTYSCCPDWLLQGQNLLLPIKYLISISCRYCIFLLFYTSYYLTIADAIYRTCSSPPKVRHRTVPALQHHHSRALQVFCEGANRMIIRHQRATGHSRCSPVESYKIAQKLKEWCLLCWYLQLWLPSFPLSFNILHLEQHLCWALAEKSSLQSGSDIATKTPPWKTEGGNPMEGLPLLKSTGLLALLQPWEMLKRESSKEKTMWAHRYNTRAFTQGLGEVSVEQAMSTAGKQYAPMF